MIKGKNYEITKENLLGHEMIGLKVKVINSTDDGKKGKEGVIVNETQNTFVILSTAPKAKEEIVLPKHECEFEFDLGNEKVKINGKDVLRRPEERVKEWRK